MKEKVSDDSSVTEGLPREVGVERSRCQTIRMVERPRPDVGTAGVVAQSPRAPGRHSRAWPTGDRVSRPAEWSGGERDAPHRPRRPRRPPHGAGGLVAGAVVGAEAQPGPDRRGPRRRARLGVPHRDDGIGDVRIRNGDWQFGTTRRPVTPSRRTTTATRFPGPPGRLPRLDRPAVIAYAGCPFRPLCGCSG